MKRTLLVLCLLAVSITGAAQLRTTQTTVTVEADQTITGKKIFDKAQFKAGPWADVKAYGAKGDCSTDDTAAFQSAVNASTLVYVPDPAGACYRVGSVSLRDGSHVWMQSRYTVLSPVAGSQLQIFNISGSSFASLVQNVHIEGGMLWNDKTPSTATAAIHIAYARNVYLENVIVDGGWYDNISADDSDYLYVTRVRSNGSKHTNLLVNYTDTSSASDVADNIYLTESVFNSSPSILASVWLRDVATVRISKCDIVGNAGRGLQIDALNTQTLADYMTDVVVEGNTIDSNAAEGVWATKIRNSSFRDNWISSGRTNSNSGLYVEDAYSVGFSGNQLYWNGQDGLQCNTCRDITVSENQALNNSLNGIRLIATTESSVFSNKAYNHSFNGGAAPQQTGIVIADNSSGLTVYGNRASGNTSSQFYIGGTGHKYVEIDGKVTATTSLVSDGGISTPSYSFAGQTNTGFYRGSGTWGSIGAVVNGNNSLFMHAGGFDLPAANTIDWNSDVVLARDTAGVLAQRNGTNAQTFRLYGTYTDASNYERAALTYDAGQAAFGLTTEKAGTGAARSLMLGTAGTWRWYVDSSGHIKAIADNTYDIGATGASRPRTGYFGTSIVTPWLTDNTQGIRLDTASNTVYFGKSGAWWNVRIPTGSNTGALRLSPAVTLSWATDTNLAADDTSLSRCAAGVTCVGTGASGDASGTLKAASVIAPLIAPPASGTLKFTSDLTAAANNFELAVPAAGASDQLRMSFTRGTRDAGAGTNKGMVMFATETLAGWADYENRSLTFWTGAGAGALQRWSINNGGHFLAGADNTYDIGASGASRPRDGWFGRDVRAAGSVVAPILNTSSTLDFGTTAFARWWSGSAYDTGLSRTAAGRVAIGNGTAGDKSGSLEAASTYLTSGLGFGSTAYLGWNSGGNPSSAWDTSFSRNAAGVVQVGDGAANANGKLLASNLSNIVAKVSLTGQTASIGLTSYYTPSVSGLYRFAYSLRTTTAGSGGTVTGALYTDSGNVSWPLGVSAQLNSVNAPAGNSWVVYATGGQPFHYATTVAGAAGSPQYRVDLVVEKLQ